mgnify:CR=1 FL=1
MNLFLEKYEKLIDHALSAGDRYICIVDTGGRFDTDTVAVVSARVSISVSITVGMSVVSGVSTVVSTVEIGGVGFSLGITLGISVVGSTGDGLISSIYAGGRFAQSVSVICVRIMSVVSTVSVVSAIKKLRVGLSLGLGDSGSDNSKQDL